MKRMHEQKTLGVATRDSTWRTPKEVQLPVYPFNPP